MCGISISKRSDYSPDKTLLMRLDSSENLLGFSLFYFIFLFYIFCLDSIFFFALRSAALSSQFSVLGSQSQSQSTFVYFSCFIDILFQMPLVFSVIQLRDSIVACLFVRSLACSHARPAFFLWRKIP